jgi:UDP-N-acetylglucosamine:LPS N-acetylglucosamine transferase
MCADIGEGHLTIARALAHRLCERDEAAEVELRTDLQVMGDLFGRFMEAGFHAHLDGIGQPGRGVQRLSYELAYRVFFEQAAPRHAAHLALAALGGRGLKRTIGAFDADVVVTEYPVLSAALGQLRALGRLGVPVCSSISDPAGLYYWAHPGIDLHLLSWPEALAEVDRIAGRGRAVVVRPLIDARFLRPPTRADARRALELDSEQTVVLVSGGGWGVGDLAGAAAVALDTAPDARVICLAGWSEEARRLLLDRHGNDTRVEVLGFTDRMPELLAAASVLIHTTGGTTALEARVVGCPLINFDTTVAHVRAHARAMAEHGLAEWAPDRHQLAEALRRSLAQAPPPPVRTETLPEAAELVLQLARAGRSRGAE